MTRTGVDQDAALHEDAGNPSRREQILQAAARLFADAEAIYSYEGSNEINSLIVGRALTGVSAFV